MIRYGLWNALSTQRIEEEVTNLLTDAHEDIDYDSNYSNHYKETAMELFNNSVGRQMANETSFILSGGLAIVNALNQGELRYLRNSHF